MLSGPAWLSHHCPTSPARLPPGQIVGSPLLCEDTSFEGDREGVWDTPQTPATGRVVPTVTKPFRKGYY